MSKEDLIKYREEQDRKETEKMFKAIKENHDKAYNDHLLQEQQKKIVREKQEKKETIVNHILIVMMLLVLLAIGLVVLAILDKDGANFMQECTTAGYSENYCKSELGL